MKTKGFTRLTIAALILGFAAMVLPSAINAQGQLRYQNRYTKADVSRIIAKLESTSNVFRSDFDRAMDNSNLNGTSAEDRYNQNVADYENALDRLRRDFDRENSWWNNRNQVSNVINRAQTVNNMMNAISFRRSLERQWNNMRNELNALADTFDLPGLNGGGWNGGGGGWNGSGQTSTPPSWAQGTFYGTAPDGSQIMLTINRNGQVTANVGGGVTYGTYNRGYLAINGNSSRVNQVNNGIQTVSTMNGETINYYRGGWNSGGGWNGSGQTSTPPSWAQGTFYGTAPNGTQIALTINRNGQVTANVGGSMSYGTYYRGSLTIDGNTSRVNQISNGLQTVSTLNNETINYYRGGWNNSGGGAVGGNVPNWAVGSFRASNPVSGGTIIMTISQNGSVTVNMDGNMSYGTLNGTMLNINGNTARLTQRGNGFRTVSTGDGQTITYTRY